MGSKRHEKPRLLSPEFYRRDTVLVARQLLGKVLRVRDGKRWRSGIIVEDEAYLRNDLANHAYRGPDGRNRSMFLEPGTAYVYTMHGVHCLNVVTQVGEAILIRAVTPVANLPLPTNGPGRLCRAYGVTRARHDGLQVFGPEIEILDSGVGPPEIAVSRRVGVTRAKDRPLRFFVRTDAPGEHAPGAAVQAGSERA